MMKAGDKIYLAEDAVGPFSGTLYGSAGDQVEVISVHDNVAIVEKKEIRFTVKLSILSEAFIPKSLFPELTTKIIRPPKKKSRTR